MGRWAGFWFWRGLGAAVMTAASACAWAQDPLIVLAPSAALACMTPPAAQRGVPEYDADALERKDGGTVRVELVFASATEAPTVRHLDDTSRTVHGRAVRKHVASWRVPCLPEGAEPARIELAFLFDPIGRGRVVPDAPVDLADAARQRRMDCLTRIEPGQQPDYPRQAIQRQEHGALAATLRFTSPTEPPEFNILNGRHLPYLRAELTRFVRGYRMPCLDGAPFIGSLVYSFRLEGADKTVVNDMSLLDYLRFARQPLPSVKLDTAAMGCPFEVRITMHQPHFTNSVQQLDSANPARRLFLDWLSRVRLNLPADTEDKVLGDSFTVRVPCAGINF